jgi:hypothetical protein
MLARGVGMQIDYYTQPMCTAVHTRVLLVFIRPCTHACIQHVCYGTFRALEVHTAVFES